MHVGSLWRALLLPAGSSSRASSDGQSSPVYVALRPLVGGPKFLLLHVQIAHDGVLFDFLPAAPTEAATTANLLLGRAVDGRIRCRPTRTLARNS